MPSFLRLVNFTIWATCLTFSYQALHAQNIFFSQYYQSPLLTNPALPATTDVMAASLLYRRETVGGGQTFATPLLNISYPLYKRFEDTIGYRWAGLGLMALSDQAGIGGLLRTSGAKVSFAYLWQPIDTARHFLSFGAQAGFFQRAIDIAKLSTGSQWTGGGFDPTLPTGENIEDASVWFPTFDLGIQWHWEDSLRRPRALAGVSIMQLNRPNTSFIGQEDRIPLTLVANAGFRVYSNSIISVFPNARYIRAFNVADQLNAGVGLFYHFNKEWDRDSLLYREATLGLNIWYSPNNSVVAGIQVEHQRFSFSFSYDFNRVAPSNLALPNNAIEVQIGIRRDFGYKKRPVKRIIRQQPTPLASDEDSQTPGETLPRLLRLDVELMYARREEVSLSDAEYDLLQRSILFEFGNAELSSGSQLFLDRLITILSANPDIKLEIAGYSCNLGDPRTNRRISEERAITVWQYLMQAGIEPERLVVRGWGDLNPVASNETESGRIRNRRVQLRIVKELPGEEAFRSGIDEEDDLPLDTGSPIEPIDVD